MAEVYFDSYFHLSGYGSFLKVDSSKIDYFITYVNENKIKAIAINKYWGYHKKDISFVKDCPLLEKLFIVGDDFNIKEVNSLIHLTFLSTSSDIENLNFGNFPELEYCCINWNTAASLLEKCRKLVFLKINKYKSKNKNLCDLPKCERIIQLQLSESTITSLEGIEFYARSLKKLGLFYMSKLENIKGIASLDKVEELEIECAKKIKDISEIGKLVLLKKIILSHCGIISTIKFLRV